MAAMTCLGMTFSLRPRADYKDLAPSASRSGPCTPVTLPRPCHMPRPAAHCVCLWGRRPQHRNVLCRAEKQLNKKDAEVRLAAQKLLNILPPQQAAAQPNRSSSKNRKPQEDEDDEDEDDTEVEEEEFDDDEDDGDALAASELDLDDLDFVEVATIMGAHGVRGELRVMASTDFPEERLHSPGTRFLYVPGDPPGQFREVELLGGRMTVSKGRELHLITLEGVQDRDMADNLKGSTVLVKSDDRDRDVLDEFEYFVSELVGLRVRLVDAEEDLGKVMDVVGDAGVHSLLQVRLTSGEMEGGELLIPFQREICPEVDLEEGVIMCSPPKGLLDLATKPKARTPSPRHKKHGRSNREDIKRLKALKAKRASEREAEEEA